MNTILIIMLILFTIIVTYFKGKEGNRSIVVYEDWNDLGLSFFAIIFPVLVTITIMNIQFLSLYALPVGFALMIIMLGKLAFYTYKSNNGNLIYFLMAYITKIFLGMTLFIQILNVISSEEDENGNSSFWSAVLILIIVIPMINKLVINKDQGSKKNPLKWISLRTKFTKLA